MGSRTDQAILLARLEKRLGNQPALARSAIEAFIEEHKPSACGGDYMARARKYVLAEKSESTAVLFTPRGAFGRGEEHNPI